MQFSIQRTPLFACLFLASGFLGISTNRASASSCSVVARVMTSSIGSSYKLGDALCQGQKFTGNPIRVACSKARKVVWLNKTEDLQQCEQSSPSLRRCSLNAKITCRRIRGDLSARPLLIRPYGEVLAEPPLELRWIAIKDADHYEVHVLGDKTWKFTSTQALLKIPPIPSKSSIQIIIEAFSQGRLISASTTTFNLLEPSQFQQIKVDLNLIDRIQVSIDKKKALKLSIYSNFGLLDDSISLVQKEVMLHQDNPSNIRLLGDIYLEAGLIDEANKSYQQALDKATIVQNKDEINLSKIGLNEIIAFKLKDK
jgi:hypothetical protein